MLQTLIVARTDLTRNRHERMAPPQSGNVFKVCLNVARHLQHWISCGTLRIYVKYFLFCEEREAILRNELKMRVSWIKSKLKSQITNDCILNKCCKWSEIWLRVVTCKTFKSVAAFRKKLAICTNILLNL